MISLARSQEGKNLTASIQPRVSTVYKSKCAMASVYYDIFKEITYVRYNTDKSDWKPAGEWLDGLARVCVVTYPRWGTSVLLGTLPARLLTSFSCCARPRELMMCIVSVTDDLGYQWRLGHSELCTKWLSSFSQVDMIVIMCRKLSLSSSVPQITVWGSMALSWRGTKLASLSDWSWVFFWFFFLE